MTRKPHKTGMHGNILGKFGASIVGHRAIIPHLNVPRLYQPHRPTSLTPSICIHALHEVKQFDYLRRRLDHMMTMKAAVASIQEKANKGHSLALAVSYSLRYDKHHSNPTLCSSPVEMLPLWKSCVFPHFQLYLRYISDESQVQTLQASLNKSLILQPSFIHICSPLVHHAEFATCTTQIQVVLLAPRHRDHPALPPAT